MKNFDIDHSKIFPGIYKNSVSGLVTTWDIRIKEPNGGKYLTPAIIHSLEHTMSVYLKQRFGDYRVLGVFPLGSQTGVYVLTRFIDKVMIYEAIIDYIMNVQRLGSVPGSLDVQCGQSDLHDLDGVKKTMIEFYECLRYTNSAISYQR